MTDKGDITLQALQLTQLKEFMSHLLTQETFDAFCLCEGSITTFTEFEITGAYYPDYYELEQDLYPPDYLTWKQVRPLVFQIVKGKHTPRQFKLVFRLADYNVEKFLLQSNISTVKASDLAGLYLNLYYNGKTLTCTTGSSFRIFSLDRSVDQAWDQMVQKFLKQKSIAFEKM